MVVSVRCRAGEDAGAPGKDAGEGAGAPKGGGPGGGGVLDLWPHPLTAEGRETRPLAVPRGGAALEEVLAAALPVPLAEIARAIDAAVDGRPVPRSAWRTMRLAGGETVTVRVRLGDDDSDPLRVVLQVAVLAAAIAVPPALGLAVGTLGGALASGAIAVGGSLVVNALAPPPLAAPAGAGDGAEQAWSLAAGANRARPWEPMLLALGRHRVFPDLAQRPYTFFLDSDQYLTQVFSFGVGDLEFRDVRIGETPVGSFDDVSFQYAAPGERIRVAVDVHTAEGGALDGGPADYVYRRTPADSRRCALDFVARIFQADARTGAPRDWWVYVQANWRRAADATRAAGEWSPPQTWRLRNGSPDLLRVTHAFDLPYDAADDREFEIAVRRTTAPSSERRIFDDVTWTALRGYYRVDPDRGADWRYALQLRASGQLSGRLDRLSALVGQRIPTWTGSAWTADDKDGRAVSSNPAAVLRAFARGWRDAAGRLLAGSGRPAAQIDDAGLGAWYAWCEGQGLHCDMVLDRAIDPETVEAQIAACGRAAISWAAGRFGAVWDAAGRAASAAVSPARVIAGSMSVHWHAGGAAEEIVAAYIDRDDDWRRREVRRLAPGVTVPAYTATVSLPGVTRRAQAQALCNLQAARQLYHRRRISWTMGADGASVARGDVLWLTHDLVSGGAAGRLAGGTAAAPRLDRAIDVPAGSWMLFEAPGGALHRAAVAGAASARVEWRGAPIVKRAGRPRLMQGGTSIGWTPVPAEWVSVGAARGVVIEVPEDGWMRLVVSGDDDLGAQVEILLRIEVRAPDGTAYRISGPAAADAVTRDAREPYVWLPDNTEQADARALRAALDAALARPGGPGEWYAALWIEGGLPIPVPAETVTLARAAPLPADPSAEIEGAGPRDWTWRLYAADAPPAQVRVIAVEPRAADRFDIAAIDETPLYYAAAAAGAGALAPAPRARPVRILDVRIAETSFYAGGALAVELEAAVTVEGDWRGAEVFAAIDGGPRRRVARMGPEDLSARWIAPPRGLVAIDIAPGSGAAPAGAAYALVHSIAGAPPALPAPAEFLIDVLPSGTRRFHWTPPAWAGFAGVRIRYAAGDDTPPVAWSAMRPLHDGLLTASPWESFDPPAGRFVFAARAVDAAGNEGGETRIVAALGDPALADAFFFRNWRLAGWPRGSVADEGYAGADGALHGGAAYRWSDVASWAAWTSWGAGTGRGAKRRLEYTAPPIDIGAAAMFAARWSAETGGGAAACEYRAAAAAAPTGSWAALPADGRVSGRHVQFRWTVTGDGSAPLRLSDLVLSLHAELDEQRLTDADSSRWPGAAGARRPPHGLAVVLYAQLTLQSVGAGWSWDVAAKNPLTVRIWNASRQPADCVVDAVLRGFR